MKPSNNPQHNNARSRCQSQLRIIGGQWRGRKLSIADIDGLRPTGDRIRETLFNWLVPDIPNSQCLDLFAGSGALGFECLSRGASTAILLEKHPSAGKQLQNHCSTLNTTKAKIIIEDSIEWLKKQRLPKHSIDIAFIDPPFHHALWEDCIAALADSELLKEGAAIYIETPAHQVIHPPSDWHLHREKKASQVCYRLYYQQTESLHR